MGFLTPSKKSPGLHVSAEPIYRFHDDPAAWSTRTASEPAGSYHCGGCGQSDTARGSRDVAALVDDYTAHHGPAHKKGSK
ncbi:hypothetical protein [Streptomyces sp. NPDC047434]|uniref:hypothetical protein n=1 Tax=Streptomyces sp. NPDC047434 TaxID=3155143 RepID=UPI0033C0F517